MKKQNLSGKFTKYKIKKMQGYTTTMLIVVLSIIGILVFIIVPKVSLFKAKGQQSETRIKLVRIYNSMYAFKAENGAFPDTKRKILLISTLKELHPYLKDDEIHFLNKNDNIFILSNSEKFVIAYLRVLSNGKIDIQRINSKKSLCYMLNGLSNGSENCQKEQNYDMPSNIEDIKDMKKLTILAED